MTGKRKHTLGEIMDLEEAALTGDASAERRLNAEAKANGYSDYSEMMSEWSSKMRSIADSIRTNLRADGFGEILDELTKLRGNRLLGALRDLSFDDLRTAYADAMPRQPVDS